MKVLFAGLLALPLVASCMPQEYYVEDYPPARTQVEIYPNAPLHHHHHDYPQYGQVSRTHIHTAPPPVRPRPVIIHNNSQIIVHGHHGHVIHQPVIKGPTEADAVDQAPVEVHGHNASPAAQNNTQIHPQSSHGTSHAHH